MQIFIIRNMYTMYSSRALSLFSPPDSIVISFTCVNTLRYGSTVIPVFRGISNYILPSNPSAEGTFVEFGMELLLSLYFLAQYLVNPCPFTPFPLSHVFSMDGFVAGVNDGKLKWFYDLLVKEI
jgi:hypothetical protein